MFDVQNIKRQFEIFYKNYEYKDGALQIRYNINHTVIKCLMIDTALHGERIPCSKLKNESLNHVYELVNDFHRVKVPEYLLFASYIMFAAVIVKKKEKAEEYI